MKKNLLSIIILALLVVNIVLSAIMMISVTSASKKTAALVADISTIIGLEIDGVEKTGVVGAVSQADTTVYDLTDEMTIPLKNGEDGKAHYAVGKVSLSMNSKHEDYATYYETFSTREGLIKDIIFSVFANYTMEEAKANSNQIKAEILEKIQELFGSDFIFGVSYSFLYS
ncbi:MAG: flagellar basal body-associated FliL family protein [Lachnospiraceae bacterium]|nr:flagellar basal body-associated FliL family protein [Lachnospiraceae bacterium]